MDEEELFKLVREAYGEANVDYIKEQVKEALKEPILPRRDTLDGLLDWIVIAGCAGMNDRYRKYIYSAIAHLQRDG